MGLPAGGIGGIKLAAKDRVVGAGWIGKPPGQRAGHLAIVTQAGYAKRVPLADFPAQGRNGQGVVAAKLSDKSGDIAGAILVAPDELLVCAYAKAAPKAIPVADLPEMGRPALGKPFATLMVGEPVRSVCAVSLSDGDGRKSGNGKVETKAEAEVKGKSEGKAKTAPKTAPKTAAAKPQARATATKTAPAKVEGKAEVVARAPRRSRRKQRQGRRRRRRRRRQTPPRRRRLRSSWWRRSHPPRPRRRPRAAWGNRLLCRRLPQNGRLRLRRHQPRTQRPHRRAVVRQQRSRLKRRQNRRKRRARLLPRPNQRRPRARRGRPRQHRAASRLQSHHPLHSYRCYQQAPSRPSQSRSLRRPRRRQSRHRPLRRRRARAARRDS